MRRFLFLMTTHLAMLAIGFVGGVYTLPILTAPPAPDSAILKEIADKAVFKGRLVRNLRGSDLLHWGEGVIEVSRNRIAHVGRLSPGPDYKIYLAPRFVDTKEAFLLAKKESIRIGDVKTFNGLIVQVPEGVDVYDYTTVVIWCETFDQFISAAEYQTSRQTQK
jgi:hypothetical protein